MADELNIRAVIETILDERGLKDLDHALEKNRKSLQETKDEGLQLKESFQELQQEFLGFLAVGALSEFYREGISESAKIERAWEDLDSTLRTIGSDAASQGPKVREFVESLGGQGVLESQAIPAFTKFAGILRDTQAAEAATSLAADISAQKHMDMGAATDLVVNIIQGRMLGSLRQLGIAQVDASGKAKTHAEVMSEVIEKFSGFLAKTDDTQKALDQQAVRWENLKKSVGDAFAPAWVFVLGLFDDAIKLIQSVGTGLGGLVAQFEAFATGMRNVPNITKLFTAPKDFFKGMSDAWEVSMREMKAAGAQTAEDFYQIWNKNIAKVGEETEGLSKLKEQTGLKDRAEAEAAAKTAAEAAEKIARTKEEIYVRELHSEVELTKAGTQERIAAETKLLDFEETASVRRAQHEKASEESIQQIHQTFANERTALLERNTLATATVEQKARHDELQSEIALYKEGTRERMDAELRVLDFDYQVARERMVLEEKTESAIASFDQAYANQRIAIIQKQDQVEIDEVRKTDAKIEAFHQSALRAQVEDLHQMGLLEIVQREQALNQELASLRKSLATELADTKKTDDQKLRLAEAEAAAEEAIQAGITRVHAMSAKAIQIQYEDIAAGVLGSLSSIFGGNKALAVAATIISTYAAAQKAYESQIGIPVVGPELAVAAAVEAIVAGLARVAQIEGVGFDDPGADKAARVGGYRWATDMVREFEAGAAAAAQGRPVPGPAGSPGTPNDSPLQQAIADGWAEVLTRAPGPAPAPGKMPEAPAPPAQGPAPAVTPGDFSAPPETIQHTAPSLPPATAAPEPWRESASAPPGQAPPPAGPPASPAPSQAPQSASAVSGRPERLDVTGLPADAATGAVRFPAPIPGAVGPVPPQSATPPQANVDGRRAQDAGPSPASGQGVTPETPSISGTVAPAPLPPVSRTQDGPPAGQSTVQHGTVILVAPPAAPTAPSSEQAKQAPALTSGAPAGQAPTVPPGAPSVPAPASAAPISAQAPAPAAPKPVAPTQGTAVVVTPPNVAAPARAEPEQSPALAQTLAETFPPDKGFPVPPEPIQARPSVPVTAPTAAPPPAAAPSSAAAGAHSPAPVNPWADTPEAREIRASWAVQMARASVPGAQQPSAGEGTDVYSAETGLVTPGTIGPSGTPEDRSASDSPEPRRDYGRAALVHDRRSDYEGSGGTARGARREGGNVRLAPGDSVTVEALRTGPAAGISPASTPPADVARQMAQNYFAAPVLAGTAPGGFSASSAAPSTIINQDNRQTTFAPSTEAHVHLEGIIASTKMQLLKDLNRGLEEIQRTIIKKSRVGE